MKKALLVFVFIYLFIFSKAQSFEWVRGGDWKATLQNVDVIGNIYLTGNFSGTVDFDPGSGVFNLSSAGGDDIYILKLNPSGNFLWAKRIGGTLADNAMGIASDNLGFVYITGFFRGTADFDPGAGVHNLTSAGSTLSKDGFLCKLDPLGNFVWVNQIRGSVLTSFTDLDQVGRSVSIDATGLINLGGTFIGITDFDSSLDTFSLDAGANDGLFLAKYNSSGNFIWAKGVLGGSLTPEFSNIDDVYNIYSGGTYDGSPDFDTSPLITDTLFLPDSVPSFGYISKFGSDGNLKWARYISTVTGWVDVDCASIDNLGNIYMCGHYRDTISFDPSILAFSNIPKVFGGGNDDMFIAKMDSTGNYIWIKTLGGPGNESAADVFYGADGAIYITGGFENTVDFNPGLGTNNYSAYSMEDIFILKLDSNGNFIWAKQLGGTSGAVGTDYGSRISIDTAENILLTGIFKGTTDFDLSSSIYTLTSIGSVYDGFVLKLSQDSCANVNLIVDSAVHINCTALGYASAYTLNGLAPYSYSWNTIPATIDSIENFSVSGIYELTLTDANSCIKSTSVIINGPFFPLSFDLTANLISTNYRVGRPSTISLDAFNDGCVPTSGTLQLILDTLVIYTSALPLPDMISGDTLTWNFSNLIYDSAHVMPQVIVQTPTWAAIGDTVCFNLIMNPIVGDADPTNNTKQYCFSVINSYDPNDKKVYPVGTCSPGYINDGELLTYTVRFQNTGTAPALDVYVLDSLDADLDLNTVRVIGNSHTLITEVLPGNVLKFRFDNINLADSTSNEAESHGYVVFEVMPNASLAIGTTITNNVGIYFDFNVPVYTNTVLNTISDGILNTGTTSMANVITADLTGASYQWLDCDNGNAIIPGATNQSYTATAGGNYSVIVSDGCFADTSACVSVFVTGMSEDISGNQFSFFPNPSNNTITINTLQATQIKIVNMLGEVLIDSNVKDKSIVDISGLANGVYFIQTQEGRITKLIKQ